MRAITQHPNRKLALLTLWLCLLCGNLLLPASPALATALALPAPAESGLAESAPAESAIPTRLIIDKIAVDTTIEAVGKDEDGHAGVPADKDNVAWYSAGVAPGAQGNAVISGHLDDKRGSAVFWRLRELRVGDIITVVDSAGVERDFAVVEVVAYKWDDAPLARIFGFDLERDLNLITCAGQFSRRDANYSKRLVVYTRLVP